MKKNDLHNTKKTITLTKSGDHQVEITESGVYLIELQQPESTVTVHGVFEATGSQKINIEVILHHQAPHTRADTTLKGVARDKAAISFKGKIVIDQNCPDTQSFLTERILLLSDEAQAEAVPDLEILSDDVSCSHAASISHIPESQLFYMMSRGLKQAEAEELIVEGFLR
ncbi:MAG: SufD family Fe-S cluster assembly protein [Patescibacteria group bacterium]